MSDTISVIMAARDAEAYVGATLDSLIAQTHRDWRLLLLDDGSRDATADILSSYAEKDDRIRMAAAHREPRGVVESLNALLAQVDTELIGRSDADDLSLPNRWETLLGRIRAEDAPDCVTSRVEPFPAERLGDGMARYFEWQNGLSDSETRRDRFVEMPLAHGSILLRTDALREVGGWSDRGWPEDWDLFLRMFAAGSRFARVPETLYRWRMHAAQLTARDSRYALDRFAEARAHYLAKEFIRMRAADGERPIVVFGAGPTGKTLARGLAREGIAIDRFSDVDPKKLGGVVRFESHRWPVASWDEVRLMSPRPFGLAAVGSAAGRERVRVLLTGAGWREERDFLAAA